MGNQTSQRTFSQRQLRVGELVKQNLGELFIRNEAKIPSINSKLITVTEVRMTPDLKTARVYVIPLGGVDMKETVLGSAEIQKIFKVSNAGKIAGSKVINGEIKSKSKARIIRDGVVVYSGEIQSIYREKNQVKEVGTGLECGISLKDFIDFKEKDVIESYQADKIQRSI